MAGLDAQRGYSGLRGWACSQSICGCGRAGWWWTEAIVGATQWSYRTPFLPDIGAALQRLRWQVYRQGDYHRQEPDPSLRLTEAQFRATLPGNGDDGDIGAFLLEEWRKARSRPPVTDPDSLLAAQPDTGTHSIIDMMAVSATPDYNTVSPLRNDQLVEVFGTTTPTADQVEALPDRVLALRCRWHGVYVVSFDGAVPAEIHFLGFSGD